MASIGSIGYSASCYCPVFRIGTETPVFERFTDRARSVVVLAQEEARLLKHNYIGTEHILLGLSHEGEGVAAKALEAMGVSLQDVRSQVESIIGRGHSEPRGHIPFTPRAKKVLEMSLRESLQLGHNYIGTEHLLLGLIREGEGVGAQVLVKLGADLNRVRQQVNKLLQVSGDEAAAESGFATRGEATAFVSQLAAGADPRQILPEIAQRGRRARDLAERLARVLADPSISPDNVLYGLFLDDARLTVLEGYVAELERKPKEGHDGGEE
jgi:ATP-dependent Clp protease ATP-binding subunit ClpA